MRKIQIYIEGQMIDLFNDENIQVNSSIQNISDISKVFADYSQSFTIPATINNNKIFSHFYNSDVYKYNDTQTNPNIRRDARIEINLTPFRTGKIQLEKANLKNGKPESYSITFYGDVTSLKDTFGEDLLSDLNLDSLNHSYTGAEVKNRITDGATDYDVRYPLISSRDLWTYDDGGAYDIKTSGGRINFIDLFPAVKVKKLMEAIETKYGLTFNSTFFDQDKFNKLFLWGKNSKENTFVTQPMEIDLSAPQGTSSGVNSNPFDFTNNTLNCLTDGNLLNTNYASTYPNRSITQVTDRVKVNVNVTSTTATWYLDVYDNNNVLVNTIEGQPTNNLPPSAQGLTAVGVAYTAPARPASNPISFRFEFRATEATTFNAFITYEQDIVYADLSAGGFATDQLYTYSSGVNQTLIGLTNMAGLVPEMKISDFFSGILKMFNLTLFATDSDVYTIETLETFYNTGNKHDITEYTDIESIDVDRVPLYKRINFKYQESESFLNKEFKSLFTKEYGNASMEFAYDGGDFQIELPFENIMGTRFNDNSGALTNTQVSYALNENFESYVPKPVLMYMYDQQTTDFQYYNGSSEENISTYMPFGQDVRENASDFSLNFNADISTFLLSPVQNSLYYTYYYNYLTNLYNLQNRLVKVKTILPVSILTSLKLNDRVIIRDRRYIINDFSSSLTTGEVTFTLLLDFRPTRPVQISPAPIGANCINIPIDLSNGVASATITTTTAGVTITPSTITSSQIVQVCIPANPNEVTNIITESTSDKLNTEVLENVVTETSQANVIDLEVTETYPNGTTNTNTILITQ